MFSFFHQYHKLSKCDEKKARVFSPVFPTLLKTSLFSTTMLQNTFYVYVLLRVMLSEEHFMTVVTIHSLVNSFIIND